MNTFVERIGAYIKSFGLREDMGEFEPPQSQCKPRDESLLVGGADPLDMPSVHSHADRADLRVAMIQEEFRHGIL